MTLSQWSLQERGYGEVLTMIESVARLLAVLHGSGRVHRDLKPDNLLYMLQSTKWRLLDFGIVCNIGAPCIASLHCSCSGVWLAWACIAGTLGAGAQASASHREAPRGGLALPQHIVQCAHVAQHAARLHRSDHVPVDVSERAHAQATLSGRAAHPPTQRPTSRPRSTRTRRPR
jgi:serine/threonine protein kinase